MSDRSLIDRFCALTSIETFNPSPADWQVARAGKSLAQWRADVDSVATNRDKLNAYQVAFFSLYVAEKAGVTVPEGWTDLRMLLGARLKRMGHEPIIG